MLDKKDGRILVISQYALDCQLYHSSFESVSWETCSLRRWLNSTFVNAAFSNAEKSFIPTVTVSADKHPNYNSNPGEGCKFSSWDMPVNENCPQCGKILFRKKGKPVLVCHDKDCGYKRESEETAADRKE